MKKFLKWIIPIFVGLLVLVIVMLNLSLNKVDFSSLSLEQQSIILKGAEEASKDYLRRISQIQELEQKLALMTEKKEKIKKTAEQQQAKNMVDQEILEIKVKYQKKATKEAQLMIKSQLEILENKKEILKEKIRTTTDTVEKSELLDILNKEINNSEKIKKIALDRVARRENIEKDLVLRLTKQSKKLDVITGKHKDRISEIEKKVNKLQEKLDVNKKCLGTIDE